MRAKVVLVILCVVGASLSGAQAAVYRFESIVLPGEEPSTGYLSGTGFTAINDLGEVAGMYFKPESDGEIGYFEGFLRGPDGSIRPLRVFTNDINNAGASVGFWPTGYGRPVGFLVEASGGDEIIFIEMLSERGVIQPTVANGINDLGQVVGSVGDHASVYSSGFLRDSDGTISTFRGPGSASLVPTSINNHGQITGYLRTSIGIQGFVRDVDGAFEIFGISDYEFEEYFQTYPQGINDAGQIVGYFTGGSFATYRGFVRDGSGQVTFLDVPGGDFWTQPMSINNSGQIVGNYFSESQITTAFIATPVPIHGGLGLVTAGLLACSTMQRRRLRAGIERH